MLRLRSQDREIEATKDAIAGVDELLYAIGLLYGIGLISLLFDDNGTAEVQRLREERIVLHGELLRLEGLQ